MVEPQKEKSEVKDEKKEDKSEAKKKSEPAIELVSVLGDVWMICNYSISVWHAHTAEKNDCENRDS